MKYQNQDSPTSLKWWNPEFNTTHPTQNISPASLKNITKTKQLFCRARKENHFATVCENTSLTQNPCKDIRRKKIMVDFLMYIDGKTQSLTLPNHFPHTQASMSWLSGVESRNARLVCQSVLRHMDKQTERICFKGFATAHDLRGCCPVTSPCCFRPEVNRIPLQNLTWEVAYSYGNEHKRERGKKRLRYQKTLQEPSPMI